MGCTVLHCSGVRVCVWCGVVWWCGACACVRVRVRVRVRPTAWLGLLWRGPAGTVRPINASAVHTMEDVQMLTQGCANVELHFFTHSNVGGATLASGVFASGVSVSLRKVLRGLGIEECAAALSIAGSVGNASQ